jgi:outer membrane protein assembly factor BamA
MRKLSLLFIFFTCKGIVAQESRDTIQGSGLKVFPLPVVYYTPETEFGFGAVSLFSFRFRREDANSRNSQFQLGGAYTQRDQLLFYLPYKLYWKNEKYYSYGELGYYKYSYRFFGVGNDLPASNEELYNVDFPKLRVNLMQLLRRSLYLGISYWYADYDIVKVKEGGLLDRQNIVGQNGGTTSALGLIALYDSRDNYNYPSKGTYLEVSTRSNKQFIGSEYDYTLLSIDYVTFLSKNKNILAINLHTIAMSGEPPFNELAFLGGREKMRGYFEGRYRDRNLVLIQSEYRRFLFWRLGMVAFAGYGVVARNISDYQVGNLRLSGGLGLRYRLDEKEKINIRLDAGFGEQGNSGIYLTIGEAF